MKEIRQKGRLIIKTSTAVFIFLLFLFIQGAVITIWKIEGTGAILVRSGIIWSLVIITLVYHIIRHKDISILGFQGIESGTQGKMLYFTPLLLISVSHFLTGIQPDTGTEQILIYGFFTLSIGMAEEIYFRGIICRMWQEEGRIRAMFVSAVLFGMCHLLNIAGGAGGLATILQSAFAYIYGMVFALIIIIGKSIIPCVVLHTIHDFCTYLSADASLRSEIILGSVQFIILIIFYIYLRKLLNKEQSDVYASKKEN